MLAGAADMTENRDRSPAHEDDPFAELVRMVEDPNLSAPRYDLGASERRHSPYRPPVATASTSSHRTTPASAITDESFYSLSEPAMPRSGDMSEGSVFVPERREALHEPLPRTMVLDDFDELVASELAALEQRHGAPAQHYADETVFEEQDEEEYVPVRHASRHGYRGSGGYRRRSAFFAGGVAALVLVAMFGGYVLVSGPSVSGEGGPILIKAETEPYKIQPENPGGRTVPNQNQAVYQRTRGATSSPAPSQEMLISAAEEPMDLSFEDSQLPGVMVGVSDVPEIELASLEPENQVQPVLQPRRVQTFDVLADGTLVPRGTEALAAAREPVQTSAISAPSAEAMPAQTMTDTPAAEPAAPVPADATSIEALLGGVPTAPVSATPAAPAAEPAPVQTAALTPSETPAPATAVPADAFFVQISSQPSQALAEESRTSLASRYASAIGDRQLAIQSAEIDGRGTFYRVRVIAASREEANSVCQNVQSAGGSCFVTR